MMDRNANAAENVLVDLDQELEHIRGFICGCRCFDDGPCCQQFMDWEIVDTPNECKGDNSQTEGLRLKNPVSCSPGSSHPMTNSGSICSTGEESTHLLLYLQNHHPQASTSTNSVCLTRSMNSADINCPEQSRHIRSRTSPLLQQSAHHVKWLLPLAHQKMTKEAVIVSCCVTNRQNTWLGSVNILQSISDLLQNFTLL
ncbi:hypothetical protein NP493_472g02040 [Ridgeia piscesae]|uniref:Uncharacterized protein n=1 Tax=Ridgeia piscesae TaxID=27915 RepID=A0AAD9KZK0_RIDPI|nr:hypothetical protein NP493_472g02040 [Ridgeia piscesae]